MLIDVDKLVGAAEIAELLDDISRQRVTQLTSRPDFPKPVAVLKMGKVWDIEDVQEWIDARNKRLGRS